MLFVSTLFLFLIFGGVTAKIVNYEHIGAIPLLQSMDVAFKNRDLMNEAFSNILLPGDTFLIPNKTFFLVGGVEVLS